MKTVIIAKGNNEAIAADPHCPHCSGLGYYWRENTADACLHQVPCVCLTVINHSGDTKETPMDKA